MEPEQWLQRHPEAGSSWPKASQPGLASFGTPDVPVEFISAPILGPRLIKGSSCIVEHRIVIFYRIGARALLPGVQRLPGLTSVERLNVTVKPGLASYGRLGVEVEPILVPRLIKGRRANAPRGGRV